MSENTIATRLAEWAAGLEYGAIPAPAVEVAKLLILDQLGLQISGATLPNIRPELQLVNEMAARPESTIVGSGERTVAPYAAFIGGTLAGSSEFVAVDLAERPLLILARD
jgi:2-methylcitrate dehydratase PrpD